MRLAASCLAGLLLLASASAQAPAPAPARSGITVINPGAVNVPAASGFDREVNSAYSTTHLINSSTTSLNPAAVTHEFLAFNPSFTSLLGPSPSLTTLAKAPATNSLVYLPETNQVLIAGFPATTQPSTSNLQLVDLDTGAVTTVPLDAPIGTPDGANNGLGPYKGQVLVGTVGNLFDTNSPAGVALLDYTSGNWTWLANSYFGLRFNGIEDVICLPDGTIIFADGTFPQFQTQSKLKGQLPSRVYALTEGGYPKVLVDSSNLVDPTVGYINGLERSPDGATLYVTVTPNDPTNASQLTTANKIFAFDLALPASGGIFAQNGRIFATVDVGYPAKIRVDTLGNLYSSSGDGVQVFTPGGELLGKIVVEANDATDQSVYDMVFAGTKLVITHNTELLQVNLNATGDITTATF